ncbi:serine protease 27-like [Pecten maximus]|uniref:serine protease 27-like n=1 Tax=Pecten maximus TaxID=6579 RepID=UPI001458732C|nr:serine protease 27-like [Pecten maximus]
MDDRWILPILAVFGFAITLTQGAVPRIIGGNDAGEDAWPWQVLLLHKNRFMCGGTLLNADTVLTMAHCTKRMRRKFFRVKVGEYDRKKNERSTRGEMRIKVKKIIKHPDYDRYSGKNDLSILKLERCVKFCKYIRPIPKLADDSVDPTNRTCYVTGWGAYNRQKLFRYARILQELQTSVITKAQCEAGIQGSFNATDDMMCTSVDPKGACFGDSGSPLQCLVNRKWVHVGSVLGGNADCRGPTIYAKTSYHRDWILKNMK